MRDPGSAMRDTGFGMLPLQMLDSGGPLLHPMAPAKVEPKSMVVPKPAFRRSGPSANEGKSLMKRFLTRVCMLSALTLLPTVVAAQGTTGSISGTITDSQKSVMPGVSVLVTQVETGAQRNQVSDEHGRYRVLDLQPGTYQLQAELSGFQTVVRNQLVVAIGKDTLVDIEMKGINQRGDLSSPGFATVMLPARDINTRGPTFMLPDILSGSSPRTPPMR